MGAQVLVTYGGALNYGGGAWRILSGSGGSTTVTDNGHVRHYTLGTAIGNYQWITGGFITNTPGSPPGGSPAYTGSTNIVGVNLSPSSPGQFIEWQDSIPIDGWTGVIKLRVFWTLANFTSGSGTGAHTYDVACFTPGTSNMIGSLSYSTAVPVNFNFGTSFTTASGQIDAPTLNLPTCNPGDMVFLRMTRVNSGTATDRGIVIWFDVSLPRVVQ
jgi:hypothetical protein